MPNRNAGRRVSHGIGLVGVEHVGDDGIPIPFEIIRQADLTGQASMDDDNHRKGPCGHPHSEGGLADGKTIEGFLSPRALGRLSSAVPSLRRSLPRSRGAARPPGSSALAIEGVAALALRVRVMIGLLPWQRWRRSATLWLMPLALGCVVAHNVATHADGYRYRPVLHGHLHLARARTPAGDVHPVRAAARDGLPRTARHRRG